ncbi:MULTISPECIES: TetR/AcrR family transcriptional regulator [unclassified Ruegeria]|uniref:TetR/AcrR family transcriptional regulator n=1 Tax=unclassified Ruegeria TaxID=2625375 RepID=UPI001489C4DC|nr:MULTISPECIES: TetR/AcrR family transcriptional regulator [unclassified Ruegeria]NOD74782.1 TetR family transcriptional regulator [Ruegeria sp. HKCCD4332]NOD86733.1 TetR family transcriptional regulator [Ruegeria sp. HKCCD4318]NOE12288.1 TetR family transcriptional regulator [Ruegeria sp. HKCCD4318-2]NOG09547.1 TetR/AcrR family transcriptional regulator [Ruegeria sp. HKCCD4315]
MKDTTDDSRQKAILNSAFQAFSTYGYRKTSMDDIARGAGMSRPAVYLHYKNKEAIVSKLTELYYAEKTVGVAKALATQGSVPEVLIRAIQAQTDGMAKILASPHGLEILDNTKSLSSEIIAAGEAKLAGLYADWLTQQEQAGRVRLLADAAETGRTIAATLKGLKLIGAGAEVYEQQVAQVAALFGAGLEVR